MKYCNRCGAALGDGALLCAQCGCKVSGDEEEKPRDLWAEKLKSQETPEEAPEEKPEKRRISTEAILLDQVLGEEANGTHEKLRKTKWLAAALGLAVLLLIAALAILLFRPGQKPEGRMFLGSSCFLEGKLYSGDGDWISLGADGSAELFLLGQGEKGTYSLENGRITVTTQGSRYEGSLSGGILNLDRGEVHFTLEEEGRSSGEEIGQPIPGSLTHWEGDYYGWWQVSEAWGDWEDSQGDRWDVCGRIWLEQEDLGKLELWDTQCRLGELVAAADLQVTQGLTGLGCLENGTGRLCGFPLQPGDWIVDPAREPYQSLPGMLVLTGSFREGDNGFSYQVFLMPWGRDWNDVKSFRSSVLPGEKRLPRHYQDWYLPLVRQNAGMPESFYGLSEEETEK